MRQLFVGVNMLWTDEHRNLRVLFATSDIALAACAFLAAYGVRSWVQALPRAFYLSRGTFLLTLSFWVLAWLCVGHWSGIYARPAFGKWSDALRLTARQTAWTAVAMVLFEYLLRLDISRFFVAATAAFGFVLVLASRLTAARWVRLLLPDFNWLRHILIVGVGPRASRLAAWLEQSGMERVATIGFLTLSSPGDASCAGFVYPESDLPILLRDHVIDEVFFALESEEVVHMERLLRVCADQGVRAKVTIDFLPPTLCGIRLEQLGAMPLLSVGFGPDDAFQLLVKRILDIALAAFGLLLTAPVMLLAAIAIKLTSPGPVIFRQRRCGLNGREFIFYKFRSMVVDAEARKAEVLHLSRRQTATKILNDPRLSPIGGFLRRFSIDELPQLWNVLRGDMALVGPRPAIPSEVELYESWQRRRLRVRPGLTCLWAVNGRDRVDFETWMKLDLQYIENWSLALDWRIMLKTIPAVLSGTGAS